MKFRACRLVGAAGRMATAGASRTARHTDGKGAEHRATVMVTAAATAT